MVSRSSHMDFCVRKYHRHFSCVQDEGPLGAQGDAMGRSIDGGSHAGSTEPSSRLCKLDYQSPAALKVTKKLAAAGEYPFSGFRGCYCYEWS